MIGERWCAKLRRRSQAGLLQRQRLLSRWRARHAKIRDAKQRRVTLCPKMLGQVSFADHHALACRASWCRSYSCLRGSPAHRWRRMAPLAATLQQVQVADWSAPLSCRTADCSCRLAASEPYPRLGFAPAPSRRLRRTTALLRLQPP